MIQDLHILKEKIVKMDEIDQLFIFGKVVRLNKNEKKNYKIISSPLVNGKQV